MLRELGRGFANGRGDVTIWLLWRVLVVVVMVVFWLEVPRISATSLYWGTIPYTVPPYRSRDAKLALAAA